MLLNHSKKVAVERWKSSLRVDMKLEALNLSSGKIRSFTAVEAGGMERESQQNQCDQVGHAKSQKCGPY